MFNLDDGRILPTDSIKNLQIYNTIDVVRNDLDYTEELSFLTSIIGLNTSVTARYSDDSFYSVGYSFLAEGINKPTNSDELLYIISTWIEKDIIENHCGGDKNRLEGFLDFLMCSGIESRGLLLDKFDLSPSVLVYDEDNTIIFHINYLLEGIDGDIKFYIDKDAFFEGKIKLVGDTFKNKTYLFNKYGKEEILSFIKYFKNIISSINTNYKDLVFEDIVVFPFTTHNVCGIGLPLVRLQDYTTRAIFSEYEETLVMQSENKICCRYVICLA